MRKYLSHLSSIVKLVIDDMSVNLNVPIRSNLVHQKISGFPRILCDTKNTKVSSVSRAKWSKLPPMAICLLISTLISENQGLEKSRFASNFSSCTLGFYSSSPSRKKASSYHKPEKNPGVQDLTFF